MSTEADQKLFFAAIAAILDGSPADRTKTWAEDDFFVNLDDNLRYQGFDMSSIRLACVKKYGKEEKALLIKHLGVICAVFHTWGNLHHKRKAGMTDILVNNVDAACAKLGISIRGSAGYIKPKGPNDLSIPRVAAAWPEVTSGLISQGFLKPRVEEVNAFRTADLPRIMQFQHFISLVPKSLPHADVISRAAFSYACMVDRMINKTKVSPYPKIKSFFQLTGSSCVLTHDRATRLLIAEGVIKADGSPVDAVVAVANHMEAQWNTAETDAAK